jgi:glycosyltransferase involved in cell wall biosynthesis
MKIAFVTDSIYPYNKGGKEKRLYEISKRLSRLGHDVHIYTMHLWPTPEKTRVEHGVKLHSIIKYYPMYKGESDRRSIKEAILFSLACFKLIRTDFDVLDVDHMPYFPIFSSWIVCKLKRRKLNGTWHEALKRSEWVDYMGYAGNVAAFIERLSIRLPHTITVSSANTMELIQSELKRTKRLRIIPPGIDGRSIGRVKPRDISCDVLFVGRLVKGKNVALLVRAMAIVVQQNPEVTCIIVGTGIEHDNIIKLISKHKLQNNVHLIGNLPRARDVYAYMKAAKVFVLPSAREGFGIVVLEALACGTPVVTINSPANASRALIAPGVSGSLVSATPATLAEAIMEWSNKAPEHGAIMQQVADYDWQAIANKQAEVYAT